MQTMQVGETGAILQDAIGAILHSLPWYFWALIIGGFLARLFIGTAPRHAKRRRQKRRDVFPIMPVAILLTLFFLFLKSKVGAFQISVFKLVFASAVAVIAIFICFGVLCAKRRKDSGGNLANSPHVDTHFGKESEGSRKTAITELGDDNDWLLPLSEAERRGAIGEWQMLQHLKSSLPLGGDDGYRIIHNVMLEDDNGETTQIDFIVISKFGVFVIEAKFYHAWIFANASSAQWVATYPNGENRKFQNPLRQNFRHICVISERTGIDRDLIIPIVAFGPRSIFKTEMPAGVMHFPDVANHILSFNKVVIKPEQLDEIVDVLTAWNNDIDKAKKESHSNNLKKKHEP